MSKNRWPSLGTAMMISGPLLAKVLYFTTSLSNVGWNRFQNIYYLQNGITPMQIGELKSLGLALKFVGEPFWCLVADFTDPKLVYALVLLTQIFSMEIIRNFPITYSTIVFVKLVRTATAPTTTLTTIAALKLIEGSREGYGEQRMFGSLAWGLGAFLVGVLIDYFGMFSMFWFTYFFQSIALAIVLKYLPGKTTWNQIANVASMNDMSGIDKTNHKDMEEGVLLEDRSSDMHSNGNANADTSNTSGNTANTSSKEVSFGNWAAIYKIAYVKINVYGRELQQFLNNQGMRVILINSLLYGIVMTIMDTYLYVALEKEFHSSQAYSGGCVAMSTLGCIPFFYYSKQLIENYGHSNLILLAQMMLVVRLAIQGLLQPGVGIFSEYVTMEVLLLVQILHGFNYALFWTASVDAIYKQSPKHLVTSCMATLNLFYGTAGFGIGSLLWGYVYAFCGGMTYKFYVCAIVSNCLVIKYFYDRKGIVDDSIDAAKSVSKGDDNNGHSNDHSNASKGLGDVMIMDEQYTKKEKESSTQKRPHTTSQSPVV
jgi:hypothetical protein